MLNNLRIRFIRGEEVKYISHLDLMKVFERATRRAGISVAYSQGYNPHAHLVFGLPLSVGVTSQSEYADVELTESLAPEKFIEKLNKALPRGLLVTEARVKATKENIMASISGARYEILVATEEKQEADAFLSKLQGFIAQNEIKVIKESKKGAKEINIRPMILSLELRDLNQGSDQNEIVRYLTRYIELQREPGLLPPSYNTENIFCISALLSAGSVANLKPELLSSALNEFMIGQIKLVKVHRSGLYVEDHGVFKDPLDPCAL